MFLKKKKKIPFKICSFRVLPENIHVWQDYFLFVSMPYETMSDIEIMGNEIIRFYSMN